MCPVFSYSDSISAIVSTLLVVVYDINFRPFASSKIEKIEKKLLFCNALFICVMSKKETKKENMY